MGPTSSTLSRVLNPNPPQITIPIPITIKPIASAFTKRRLPHVGREFGRKATIDIRDVKMKNAPLEDLTVLDLTTALAGPFATLLLAGLGARVIKIENPIGGGDSCRSNAPYLGSEGGTLARRHEDDVSVSALNRLRNKLGITLNLKHPDARMLYAGLVQKADVIVENFSRG